MNIHKSKKALKRNGVLLLVYDFLLIFIILVKNKMINISEDVVFSAMISLAGGMMIDLLWIIDSKKMDCRFEKKKIYLVVLAWKSGYFHFSWSCYDV